MLRSSIRLKILAITVGLIALMVLTAVLSLVLVTQIDHRLEQLTNNYIPIYGALARTNIRSLERALALRRMIIAKTQSPPDLESYSASRNLFDAKDGEILHEGQEARSLIASLIGQGPGLDDSVALARVDTRIDTALTASRRDLDAEIARLLPLLDNGNSAGASSTLARIDGLRDAFQKQIEAIRSDMLALVQRDVRATIRQQRTLLWIAVALTTLSAAAGVALSIFVSAGMARPVKRLLEGASAVADGHLHGTLMPTTKDEIGHLTTAFNRMVEQLRLKEQIRETFGRYIDPRIVAGLLDRTEFSADGQRRVMTILFCDLKGFTKISEGMTPSGLLKFMNRYLSIMSEPIRAHQGIIDKYIGDAIMAYWGPPFTQESEHARLACRAALDMVARVASLRAELPELTGFRQVPIDADVRIGIVTGEVIVGSMGSEFSKTYTVLGDSAILASRLEGVNKLYETRVLVSASTEAALAGEIEVREIDRIVVAGQNTAQTVFEIMARAGALTPEQVSLKMHYADGLAAYRARRWDEALASLGKALEAVPGDGPSTTLTRRIRVLVGAQPGLEWDATWRLDQK